MAGADVRRSCTPPAAKVWFDGLTNQVCYFCRTTQQGFLRLATNRQVFGANALTLEEVWRAYDLLGGDPRISFADEPPNLEARWRDFTQRRSFSPQVWNDAYLAAFAAVAQWEVVTFDRGFSQYAGVRLTLLS